MEKELARALAGGEPPTVVVGSQGRLILAHVNAVPAAMSVAAAREMVGQPFRRDAELIQGQPVELGGPVHFVACHRA